MKLKIRKIQKQIKNLNFSRKTKKIKKYSKNNRKYGVPPYFWNVFEYFLIFWFTLKNSSFCFFLNFDWFCILIVLAGVSFLNPVLRFQLKAKTTGNTFVRATRKLRGKSYVDFFVLDLSFFRKVLAGGRCPPNPLFLAEGGQSHP